MAQGTANSGRVYGTGSVRPRAVIAGVAAAAVIGFVATWVAGSSGIAASDGAAPAVSPTATIAQVDDFVSRRYLSNPAVADDSWKDDHITRKYLPGD